ncbi:MAG: hypothetical protein M3Q83_05760 [Pseudomonadota bacterium]|nr:hypothetical protein [Pseudomonadota bacterium]
MRYALILLPAVLIAAPAVAAPPIAVPPVLTDPAMADQLGRVAGALTRSLMNLPVGELEAAIEGRPMNPADRARTVRDSVGDSYVEQRVAADAAATGRTMQAATRALVGALPAIMGALAGVEAELERAVANIPDPTYPRR